VLLDPFEEQLHLPPVLVLRSDSQGRQRRVVGPEDQRLARLGILETDTPQVLGIVRRYVKAVHRNGLVANHAGGPIGRCRVHASRVHIAFGTRNEEGVSLMQRVQPRKVQIAAIHDVERACFNRKEAEHVDVAHLAIADVDEGGNRASQAQRVDGIGLIQSQILVAVELARAANKYGGKIGPDAPIVRIDQRRAMHCVTQAHRIQLVGIGAQRYFDIAQALVPRQLRKSQDTKLVGASCDVRRHCQHSDSRCARNSSTEQTP